MKNKILYIILGLLFINALYGWIKKEDVMNFDYLRTEHSKIRNEIKVLNTKLIKYDKDIKRIKNKMGVKDSIIENANNTTLDSLFDDFFNRTRGQSALFHVR